MDTTIRRYGAGLPPAPVRHASTGQRIAMGVLRFAASRSLKWSAFMVFTLVLSQADWLLITR